ncbi:MAG: YHS domain-containing (seleno)protein [Saprospiraceae bacterium]
MKLALFSLIAATVMTTQYTAIAPPSTPENRNVDSILSQSGQSNRDQRIKHFRLDKNRVAMDGYDPVSYFKSTGPQKGNTTLAYDFDGVIYWFANAANLAEFKTNPAVFEPVWGGWCGHAMALRGEKVEINPVCYKIVNGRNVLFFKTFYANALTNWEKELKKTPEQTLMTKGDDFWGKLFSK